MWTCCNFTLIRKGQITTLGTHPLLFSNSLWVLERPTKLFTNKCYETGSTVYDLHPRRIAKVAVSPQLFEDPDC